MGLSLIPYWASHNFVFVCVFCSVRVLSGRADSNDDDDDKDGDIYKTQERSGFCSADV